MRHNLRPPRRVRPRSRSRKWSSPASGPRWPTRCRTSASPTRSSNRCPPRTSASSRTRTWPSRCSVCPASRSIAPTVRAPRRRIRGLDQNVTLLNDDIFLSGLELYTQGEGNVREADSLEGIPSELLGGIDVYKSPNASQSESGLGGIINLKTRSPFDLERHDARRQPALRRQRRGLGAARRAGVQSRVQRAPGRHRIGVLRQAAVPDGRARRSEPRQLAVFRIVTTARRCRQNYFAPEYRYATDRDEERERLGASLAVAFRPTDATETRSAVVPLRPGHPDAGSVRSSSVRDGRRRAGHRRSRVALSRSTRTACCCAARLPRIRRKPFRSSRTPISLRTISSSSSSSTMAARGARAPRRRTPRQTRTAPAPTTTCATRSTRVRGEDGVGFAPNASAPPNYRFTYYNNDGTLPSFAARRQSGSLHAIRPTASSSRTGRSATRPRPRTGRCAATCSWIRRSSSPAP